ncbi:hypothetical protein PAERUG_P18_London_17_VIM_2_04_10_02621 [Pseudomonas aeruginosa]|nr:hypothetical protein PAERUG_P18_London_17_VIM_2_04_10_02621 [Pseudomonas aeruginosa]
MRATEGPAVAADDGPQRDQRPTGAKHADLPGVAAGQLRRQQAVAPQQRQAGQRQAAADRQVQRPHQTNATTAADLALGQPDLQPAEDHHRPGQPEQQVHPAHQLAAPLDHVQAGQPAVGGVAGRIGRLGMQQFAAGGIEVDRALVVEDARGVAPADVHGGRLVIGMMDADPARRAAVAPDLAGLDDQAVDGRRRPRRAADFLAFVGALHFMEEALAIVLVDHLQARLHVVDDEDHQAGVGDHQVERQADHPQHVVRVEPGALPRRLRAQGEEVLEDPPVHDGPADQRHQHQHPGDADDVQADHAGVQVVV